MLNITTGVAIPVTRDGQEAGTIRFNPNDVAFAEKVYDLIGELDAAEQEYTRRANELEADKTEGKYGLPANQRERLGLLREVCETMHTRIDGVFGEGTAQICFGGALDLDAIWQFFDGIAPHLDEAHQERIQRYTQRHGNRQQRRALGKK